MVVTISFAFKKEIVTGSYYIKYIVSDKKI